MKRKTRFLGIECGRCGGRERYVVSHSCTACKAEQTRARRIAADNARKAAGTSQTYRGAKCPRGHRVRFRATGKCVACDRASYRASNQHRTPLAEVSKRARTPNRKKALAKGARYYEGGECRRGHTLRFTRDGSCVECKRTYFGRAPRAVKDRALRRQRENDRRAYRALKVLQELGIPL
jgi:hypothetical protein